MGLCGCCAEVKNTIKRWNDAKDQWIGKQVVWILGERQHTRLGKNIVTSIAATLGIGAIGFVAIASIYKDSISKDTKVFVTVATGVAYSLAVIAFLVNEIIFRYQPRPPFRDYLLVIHDDV